MNVDDVLKAAEALTDSRAVKEKIRDSDAVHRLAADLIKVYDDVDDAAAFLLVCTLTAMTIEEERAMEELTQLGQEMGDYDL